MKIDTNFNSIGIPNSVGGIATTTSFRHHNINFTIPSTRNIPLRRHKQSTLPQSITIENPATTKSVACGFDTTRDETNGPRKVKGQKVAIIEKMNFCTTVTDF